MPIDVAAAPQQAIFPLASNAQGPLCISVKSEKIGGFEIPVPRASIVPFDSKA